MSQYEYELVEDHSESLDISPPTLGDIFSNLNSPQSKVPRDDTFTPYRMVQTLLITGNVDQLVKHLEMCAQEVAASFDANSKHSATPIWFLRFSVHLLIFLERSYPITEERENIDETASANIIKQYIKYLIRTDQGHLVAFYASFLPVDDSVEVYANFLSDITVYDKRLDYLQRAYLNGLDVLRITEKVVADIMQEPDRDRTDDFNYITQQDKRRISALEWLLFNEEQHVNAVLVANSVVRAFLRKNKFLGCNNNSVANKILAAMEVYTFLSPRLSKTITTMEHFPPQEYYRELVCLWISHS
jgi:nuclear pore complex protein Nup107